MSEKLLSSLVELMQEADLVFKSGKDKKRWVLDKLREELKMDERVEDIIIHVIDILIEVDKGKIRINPKVRAGLFSCCK